MKRNGIYKTKDIEIMNDQNLKNCRAMQDNFAKIKDNVGHQPQIKDI